MTYSYFLRLFGFFPIMLLLSSNLLAQHEEPTITATHAIYLEIGGNTGIYSINYEKIFYQNKLLKTAARVGFSAMPVKIEDKTFGAVFVPIELIGLIGRSKHYLEVGLGVTPYRAPYATRNSPSGERRFDGFVYNAAIPFRIGYRYQKTDGGFFFRAAYTPIVDLPSKAREKAGYSFILGGISIGKSF